VYRKAFDRYVQGTIADRIRRLEGKPGREAIATFYREILDRSLTDGEHKGCIVYLDALPNAQISRLTTF
jgi:TetR/AcrR family transcriptional repressor of nem operon